jgi:hypothetical protein
LRGDRVLITVHCLHPTMISGVRECLLILGCLFLLIIPASAGYALQNVEVHPPDEILDPGTPLTVLATTQILPQGPTTYIEGYTMVVSTELDRARWDVAVMVDGREAAVFEKTGTTVFISGYLLSYPTSKDVAVRIFVSGYSPFLPAGEPFTALRVVELNNQGQLIPGSEQTVSRLTGPTPSVSQPQTHGTTVTPPGTTKAAGLLPFTVIGGMVAVLLFMSFQKIKN